MPFETIRTIIRKMQEEGYSVLEIYDWIENNPEIPLNKKEKYFELI